MDSHNPQAFRHLEPDGAAVNSEMHSAETSPATVSEQGSKGFAHLIADNPSRRLIYLDEDVMRAIGLQVISDPLQFNSLKVRSANDNVALSSINDARTISAVYFAQIIWYIPPNETLIDFPPLDQKTISGDELYPGAVVRTRAVVESKQDVRPERLTLTAQGKRIHVTITNRGALSVNRSFLFKRVLYVAGYLSRLNPLSLTAAAILLERDRN
jgi:hypothetical protein